MKTWLLMWLDNGLCQSTRIFKIRKPECYEARTKWQGKLGTHTLNGKKVIQSPPLECVGQITPKFQMMHLTDLETRGETCLTSVTRNGFLILDVEMSCSFFAFPFCSSFVVLWLSRWIMFSWIVNPCASKKFFVQITFAMISSVDTSSDSVELRVLIFYFVEIDVTAPCPSVKNAPVWLL